MYGTEYRSCHIIISKGRTLTEEIVLLQYYSYVGSYLKAVSVIAEIWNSILCFTDIQSLFIYSRNCALFCCRQFLL